MLYTGEDKKRKAGEQKEKPKADEFPEQEGDPKTKEDVLKQHKKTLVIQMLGQEFLYTPDGQLWCWGLTDDIVLDNMPLSTRQRRGERAHVREGLEVGRDFPKAPRSVFHQGPRHEGQMPPARVRARESPRCTGRAQCRMPQVVDQVPEKR